MVFLGFHDLERENFALKQLILYDGVWDTDMHVRIMFSAIFFFLFLSL